MYTLCLYSEKKIEAAVVYGDYIGITGYTLTVYRDNGKENGNCYTGLYRDYYKDPFLHS